MEKEFSFEGIEPARWPSVRKRVAVLEAYVKIKRPTAEQADLYAEKLGLRRSTFYALARVWRETRDPRQVGGTGALRSGAPTVRRTKVDDLSVSIIHDVLADLGVWTGDASILKAARARMSEANAPRVADQSIRLIIDHCRSRTTQRSPFQPAVLIEECYLRLPLRSEEGTILPLALLAVVLPENVIAAWKLGTDARPPELEMLLGDIEASIAADAAARPVIGTDIETLARLGYCQAGNISGQRPKLRKVLGASFGGIEFLVRPRTGGLIVKPMTRFKQSLAQSDVATAVDAAIRQHNSARGGLPRFSLSRSHRVHSS